MRNTCGFAALLALVVAGCNGGSSWYRAGASKSDIDSDLHACDQEARDNTVSFGDDPAAGQRLQELMNLCMRMRGYTYGKRS